MRHTEILICGRDLVDQWSNDNDYSKVADEIEAIGYDKVFAVTWPEHVSHPRFNGDCTFQRLNDVQYHLDHGSEVYHTVESMLAVDAAKKEWIEKKCCACGEKLGADRMLRNDAYDTTDKWWHKECYERHCEVEAQLKQADPDAMSEGEMRGVE